jgi:hypothetical protein
MAARPVDLAAEVPPGEKSMSPKTMKRLALAGAGAMLLSAAPAVARTVVVYYAPSGFISGYVVYGNDGHICEQYGSQAGFYSTYQVDGDC